MQQQNPFSNWSKQQSKTDIHQIEQAFLNGAGQSFAVPKTNFTPSQSDVSALALAQQNKAEALSKASLAAQDKHFIEQLATLISDKLVDAIDSKELLVDRAKLEELKVDNQLMARHIYSLIQNRDIQNKQLGHLQKEQGKMKKLFWKFFVQQS